MDFKNSNDSFTDYSSNMTSVEDMDYNQSITDFELIDRFWQSFLITLYSLTAAVSFIGNIIAIWVLMAGKRSSRELRMFLVNLSLSDVIMALFSIPFTYTDFIMGRWIFMPQFCPIVQFMQLTSVFVSVYTLTIIGIDRYIAIMYPFGTSRWSKSLGPYIVSAIWLLGIGLGSVTWFNSVAEPFVVNNETYYDCRETWTEQGKRTYTLNIFMITFALPLLVLSYVYGAVGYKMIRHSMPGNADAARDEAQHLAKVKVIKMLSTIVILFALCWLPIHVLNLVISFKSEWLESLNSMDSGPQLYVALVISAHWLSMSNSFVNPVIYCFMSDNFRTDLKCLAISRCKGRRIKKSANGRSDDGKGRSLHKIRFRSSMAAVNGNTETTSINQSSSPSNHALSPMSTIRSIGGQPPQLSQQQQQLQSFGRTGSKLSTDGNGNNNTNLTTTTANCYTRIKKFKFNSNNNNTINNNLINNKDIVLELHSCDSSQAYK